MTRVVTVFAGLRSRRTRANVVGTLALCSRRFRRLESPRGPSVGIFKTGTSAATRTGSTVENGIAGGGGIGGSGGMGESGLGAPGIAQPIYPSE